MKFVAILDEIIDEIDDHKNNVRLRVPKMANTGDVVCLVLNNRSEDPLGNLRHDLRIYALPHDRGKLPPIYHCGNAVPSTAYQVFKCEPFEVFLYVLTKPQSFMKLRNLLSQIPIDVITVFTEFDQQILKLSKDGALRVSKYNAERLYEKAMKCKARYFGTTYENEAEISFNKAVNFLKQIIGMEDEDKDEDY